MASDKGSKGISGYAEDGKLPAVIAQVPRGKPPAPASKVPAPAPAPPSRKG